jgi:hypothetical protein
MSIKSQTPGVASDRPLHERDHEPNYEAQGKDKKMRKLPQSQVNNISGYVKTNLAKTVKPRGQENR